MVAASVGSLPNLLNLCFPTIVRADHQVLSEAAPPRPNTFLPIFKITVVGPEMESVPGHNPGGKQRLRLHPTTCTDLAVVCGSRHRAFGLLTSDKISGLAATACGSLQQPAGLKMAVRYVTATLRSFSSSSASSSHSVS